MRINNLHKIRVDLLQCTVVWKHKGNHRMITNINFLLKMIKCCTSVTNDDLSTDSNGCVVDILRVLWGYELCECTKEQFVKITFWVQFEKCTSTHWYGIQVLYIRSTRIISCRKPLVCTGWVISLFLCMNWLRKQSSGYAGPPFWQWRVKLFSWSVQATIGQKLWL